MKFFRLAILASVLTFTATAHAAGPRVLHSEAKWVLLGGTNPRFYELPLNAVAGETLVISIWHGADDVGDKGMTWRLEDLNGKILAKGTTAQEEKVSWNVKLKSSHPILTLEDKDTNLGSAKFSGNGVKLRVTAQK